MGRLGSASVYVSDGDRHYNPMANRADNGEYDEDGKCVHPLKKFDHLLPDSFRSITSLDQYFFLGTFACVCLSSDFHESQGLVATTRKEMFTGRSGGTDDDDDEADKSRRK